MNYTNCINCFTPLNGNAVCQQCGFDHSTYAPQSHHLPPGTLLRNRYLIGKALGQGGFGITYAGFDINLTRKVAIKEFFPEGTVWRDSKLTTSVSCYNDASFQERYDVGIRKCMNEAQSLARLDDIPNIVRVLDYFKENNTAYIIMEFVEGVTLKAFLRQQSHTMSFQQAVKLLSPVGTALQEIHRRAFVHRDISPDNIMICPNGKTKLLDFGAVKTVAPDGSATINLVVKRGFSPIEMYSTTGKIGPWSDVYSYCATLFYIISKSKVDEPLERMGHDSLGEKLANLVLPAQRSVLEKGLALQPYQRYQNMSELLAALDAHHADPVSFSRQTPPQDPVRKGPAMQTPSQNAIPKGPAVQKPQQTPIRREPAVQTPFQNNIQKGPAVQEPYQSAFQKGPAVQEPSWEPEPQRSIAKKTLIALIAAAAVLLCILIGILVSKATDDDSGVSAPDISAAAQQENAASVLSETRVLMGYNEYSSRSVFGSKDYKRSEIVRIGFLDSLSEKPSAGA